MDIGHNLSKMGGIDLMDTIDPNGHKLIQMDIIDLKWTKLI